MKSLRSYFLQCTFATTLVLSFTLLQNTHLTAQDSATQKALHQIVKKVLKRENIPVTHPHEWPANMLKDVVVYAADQISSNNNNILDRSPFTKLLTPLVLMSNKEHALARKILVAQADENNELVEELLNQRQKNQEISEFLSLIDQHKSIDYLNFCKAMLPKIKEMDVTPSSKEHQYKSGGYRSYYADKKEDFSIESQKDWHNKQKNVYKILQELKPKTVLDVGSNAGWFSKLAEDQGAKVIATDIDESSLDSLCNYAKTHKKDITSLILPFAQCDNQKVVVRLKSDVVLCLALIHHLVFVAELKLDEIFEKLAKLTNKVLVFEFVDINDEKVQRGLNDQTMLKNIKLFNRVNNVYKNYGKNNYNSTKLIEIAKKYFKSFYILDSHPSTRKIFVFSK